MDAKDLCQGPDDRKRGQVGDAATPIQRFAPLALKSISRNTNLFFLKFFSQVF